MKSRRTKLKQTIGGVVLSVGTAFAADRLKISPEVIIALLAAISAKVASYNVGQGIADGQQRRGFDAMQANLVAAKEMQPVPSPPTERIRR